MRLAALLVLAFAQSACSVTVTTESCSDGLLNGTESDVDCGGSCAACGAGRVCDFNVDCASGVCDATNHCASGTRSLPSSAGASTYHIDPGAALLVSPGTQAGYGVLANT